MAWKTSYNPFLWEKKSSQIEIKIVLTEMQSWMDAVMARMNETEQRISDIQENYGE